MAKETTSILWSKGSKFTRNRRSTKPVIDFPATTASKSSWSSSQVHTRRHLLISLFVCRHISKEASTLSLNNPLQFCYYYYFNITQLFFSFFSTFRGRLQRLLSGVHVHLPRLWRWNTRFGLDGRFEKRRRSLRKERSKFLLLLCCCYVHWITSGLYIIHIQCGSFMITILYLYIYSFSIIAGVWKVWIRALWRYWIMGNTFRPQFLTSLWLTKSATISDLP